MRLNRLVASQPRELVTLLRCLAAILTVEILWRANFSWLRSMVHSNKIDGEKADEEICLEVARLITPAYTLLRMKPTCLKKAMATALALRSFGVSSRVVLGVNANDGFRAHAWLCAGEFEFLREADCTYQPLAIL